MSKATFYKKRKGSIICGVVAGLSDKYGWELPLARILAALFMYIFPGAIILYIILAVCLPYKEDLKKIISKGLIIVMLKGRVNEKMLKSLMKKMITNGFGN